MSLIERTSPQLRLRLLTSTLLKNFINRRVPYDEVQQQASPTPCSSTYTGYRGTASNFSPTHILEVSSPHTRVSICPISSLSPSVLRDELITRESPEVASGEIVANGCAKI
ncbi:hypothetical protein SNOG_15095 [Parastagonospora nodorum SN15]|uniref:Uncharacterized protein n=1 Tax=Phaeosphaeria nodorum (strain SN15 / ATCC MYA-4574 / FGSC 10173) TaxID=321614 RepID=Q0TZT7_PHANO|nr:hypothetical protein SNOG_15095 [Parastagonospora nodorum SN15]EAT77638.1 hypothetical protein SNOG_15095 [Parastagonospora nodorum SN15]